MNKVAIIAAVHGNEVYGIDLHNIFVKKYPELSHSITLIIGNKKAYQNNVRFIEFDMNRIYDSIGDSSEHIEISRVDSDIKAFSPDYIIDIHTTKRSSGVFFISDRSNRARQRIYDMLDIDICIMQDPVIKNSLVGVYANAVSLEYSLRSISPKTIETFTSALAELILDETPKINNQRRYIATKLISKEDWQRYKGLKTYEQKSEGIALMVPANESEMDAEYYGFWCAKV